MLLCEKELKWPWLIKTRKDKSVMRALDLGIEDLGGKWAVDSCHFVGTLFSVCA